MTLRGCKGLVDAVIKSSAASALYSCQAGFRVKPVSLCPLLFFFLFTQAVIMEALAVRWLMTMG